MNVRNLCKWCVVGTLLAVVSGFGLYKTLAEPAQANAEEGVEVLTRGPVHEAFAETVSYDPEPGVVVSKSPPAASSTWTASTSASTTGIRPIRRKTSSCRRASTASCATPA